MLAQAAAVVRTETRASSTDRPRPRLAYRPGQDGLRALAVIAVFAYHARLPWARARFLGVDLFFVLSGYLITALLLADWREDGRLNILRFWGRRARRLLPVVVVMLAAVLRRLPVVLARPHAHPAPRRHPPHRTAPPCPADRADAPTRHVVLPVRGAAGPLGGPGTGVGPVPQPPPCPGPRGQTRGRPRPRPVDGTGRRGVGSGDSRPGPGRGHARPVSGSRRHAGRPWGWRRPCHRHHHRLDHNRPAHDHHAHDHHTHSGAARSRRTSAARHCLRRLGDARRQARAGTAIRRNRGRRRRGAAVQRPAHHRAELPRGRSHQRGGRRPPRKQRRVRAQPVRRADGELFRRPKGPVVNLKVDRAWEENNNEVIREGIKRWPNAVPVDWHSAVDDHAEVFYNDGLHLTTAGMNLFTQLIQAAL